MRLKDRDREKVRERQSEREIECQLGAQVMLIVNCYEDLGVTI